MIFLKYTPLYVQMYSALYCLNLCIFRVMLLLYVDNCLHVDLAILDYREYNHRCYCTIIAVNIYNVFFCDFIRVKENKFRFATGIFQFIKFFSDIFNS